MQEKDTHICLHTTTITITTVYNGHYKEQFVLAGIPAPPVKNCRIL